MNEDRRDRIRALIGNCSKLESLVAAIQLAKTELEEASEVLINELEKIRNEEQDSYDNITDNLQKTKRASEMEETIYRLDFAIGNLSRADETFDAWSVNEYLYMAIGELQT